MNQIMKREPGSVVNWEDETMRTFIKEKYAPNSTPIEFHEFMWKAKMADANPILSEIYFIKFGGKKPKAAVVFSINWMIKKAHESGIFRGFTLPWYRGKNGIWYEGVFEKSRERGQVPTHCKIGVIRSDHPEPLWGIISWAERAKEHGEWLNQPLHMMSIRAQAEGLRKTIPGLSTYYIKEEFYRDDKEEWVHDPERPATEQAIEAGQVAKERADFKQGNVDPGTGKIDPGKRQQIKRLCHGLGYEKAVDYIPYINKILDDHGLPEIPEGKDTKSLTVASGEVVLKALWEQTPEEEKETITDADLAPEEDKTGLFKEGENDG